MGKRVDKMVRGVMTSGKQQKTKSQAIRILKSAGLIKQSGSHLALGPKAKKKK
jgi:hypothetical protein